MWFRRPTITSRSIVIEYLVNGRFEPGFYTLTRLSKLSKTQRDVVLILAQRIRQAAKLDTLTLKLPRLTYLQNIVNYLIDILEIGNEAKTEQVKEAIGKIPESIIDKFIRSAAVSLQKKVLLFGELDAVIRDNHRELSPAKPAV